MLVKQRPANKAETPFNPAPYKVTEVKGTMVTAEKDGHRITRNSSHFKPIVSPPQPEETITELHPEGSNDEPESCDMDANGVQEPCDMGANGVQETCEVAPLRRSTRQKKAPSYLKDFVLGQ